MTIPTQSSGTAVQLPAITLKRGLAKVSVNLKVADNIPDIELRSIQLVNMPRTLKPFNENQKPSPSGGAYTQSPVTIFSATKTYTKDYYLFENLQGVNEAITSQQQKGPDNAPKFASYLLIRAERAGQALSYYIFLGDNNTSDFNVRRNTCYNMNITILGASQVDTRVTGYYLNVTDDFEADNYNGFCVPQPSRRLSIDVQGVNQSDLTGTIGITNGFTNDFSFNNLPSATIYGLVLPNKTGQNEFSINYSPALITRDKRLMEYVLLIGDNGGIMYNIHKKHTFANAVFIDPVGSGTISASGALFSQTQADHTFVALCYEDGCTLKASPNPGTTFEGWYADAGYTRLLSSASTFTYKPTSCRNFVFPKFSAAIPLDINGSANCYIAPARNTNYSFNSMLMGNNKGTFNITAKALFGASAKVIWETGRTRGSVISNVSLTNWRVCFRTGASEGNALIGLFDSNGKCIWSWHIWATNFNPAATAQTYRNGAVFMDRNIGALSSDHTHFTSRGLYYQWGRKDPFLYADNIYPRSQAPAVYSNDFQFEKSNAAATLEYAISHPTTYFGGSSEWLSTPNLNLWGNTSPNTESMTNTGSKSIYDPCPPGWRVPDRTTWQDANPSIIGESSGYYFTCDMGCSTAVYYPKCGFFDGENYNNCGMWGYTWSNAPKGRGATFLMLDSKVNPVESTSRHCAIPVRCIRE